MRHGRAQSALRWGGAGALLLVWTGGGSSCAAPPVSTVPLAQPAREERRFDERFAPAFAQLHAALDAHDDELAARLLERILARRPDALTRAHAETFGRILTGRALARDLELELVPSSVLDDPAKVRLELVARHPRADELVFRGGPGTLRVLLTGVDPVGTEQRVSRALALPATARIGVPPGRGAVLDLGEFEVSGTRNLALQADWELTLRSGTLRLGGEEYPANELVVRPAVTLRMAPWLPTAPVAPAALAEYVAGGGRAMPALMERAVRVDLDQRPAALDALIGPALALPRDELALLVPALRWLSGRRDLGAEPRAWQRWLDERATARAAPASPGALDLPETPAGADARVRAADVAGGVPER